MSAQQRLEQMGVVLPAPPRPLGAYVPVIETGNLLFLSGMLPIENGVPKYTGRIGNDLTEEQARAAVVSALLNGLAVIQSHTGSLDRVQQVVRLSVILATTDRFQAHAAVADAASAMLREIFGEAAGHSRMVFGVRTLPGGMPVELEIIVQIAG